MIRVTGLTVYDRCAHISLLLQHLAHERCVFKMPYQVKRIPAFTQCRSSMSIPKQWTNHRTLEAGQTFQAFVYSSKLATVLFDSNLVEEALIVAVSRYPELYNILSDY